MSLELMKKRIAQSGLTTREEMIRDGQNILKEELEHDSSYSPTLFLYNSIKKIDEKCANLRVYGRKYSSLNGNYMNFLTSYDNPIKIGDYLHDTKDDTFWLVYDSFNVNDTHYEGKLVQCNYLLKWQLSNGDIVERWANIVSASKYDVGENGNHTLVLSSNNFTIAIGFCDEGFELDGKRVFIDKNPNPRKVFKITRSDDVLFDSFSMGAKLIYIADKTEYNPNTDRPDIKICDYVDMFNEDGNDDIDIPQTNVDKTTFVCANIKGIKTLKVGVNRTCTATIINNEGNELEWENDLYGWNIISDINISYVVTENKMRLFVDDEGYIGNSFFVQVIDLVANQVIGETKVSVIGIV